MFFTSTGRLIVDYFLLVDYFISRLLVDYRLVDGSLNRQVYLTVGEKARRAVTCSVLSTGVDVVSELVLDGPVSDGQGGVTARRRRRGAQSHPRRRLLQHRHVARAARQLCHHTHTHTHLLNQRRGHKIVLGGGRL